MVQNKKAYRLEKTENMKMISLKKEIFIKIFALIVNEDRINIVDNPEYSNKILVVAGGEVFKKLERMKLREKTAISYPAKKESTNDRKASRC